MNEARLDRAIDAAVASDRDALSYLWALFADGVVFALVYDGIADEEARSLAASAFVPAVIANCRDRHEVLQCLFDGARELAPQI